jgi:endonuclease/exonuclease/phosphatase family metal-dependent hydrolase
MRTATILLVLLAAPAIAQPAPAPAPENLRVVSFNLWHSSEKLKERTEVTRRILAAEHADLIGLQEASDSVWRKSRAKLLAKAMGYRYDYRPSDGVKFVFREGLAALSPRPILNAGRRKLIHSKPWPFERRYVQWIHTRLPSGQRVVLFNTHFTHHDHDGYQIERLEQALDVLETVADRALARDIPAVLMGDFNSEPSHLAMQALTGDLVSRAPFVDAWRVAGRGLGHTSRPDNPYNDPSDKGHRIDYVLLLRGTSLEPRAKAARLLGTPVAGRVTPSDHYGLAVDLELRPRPAVAARAGVVGRLGPQPSPALAFATAALHPPASQGSAQRAARLKARVARVRGQIKALRQAVTDRLTAAAEDRWDDASAHLDPAEIRAEVLRRFLARHSAQPVGGRSR